jgi:hypothetical protein
LLSAFSLACPQGNKKTLCVFAPWRFTQFNSGGQRSAFNRGSKSSYARSARTFRTSGFSWGTSLNKQWIFLDKWKR